jgi:hypothetical protein
MLAEMNQSTHLIRIFLATMPEIQQLLTTSFLVLDKMYKIKSMKELDWHIPCHEWAQ